VGVVRVTSVSVSVCVCPSQIGVLLKRLNIGSYKQNHTDIILNLSYSDQVVFTARCYASAVLAMGLCLSVCLCLSQVGVLLKRLNVGSHKQHRTIVQGLQFSGGKDLREIRPGSPPTRAPNAGGVGQNRRLSKNIRLYLENGKR